MDPRITKALEELDNAKDTQHCHDTYADHRRATFQQRPTRVTITCGGRDHEFQSVDSARRWLEGHSAFSPTHDHRSDGTLLLTAGDWTPWYPEE